MTNHVRNKKDILIVDHDQSLTQMLKMILETRGYSVKVARTAKDAFKQVSVTTDLILFEILLPDRDGFDVCRLLKKDKKTSHIPIIILSSGLNSEKIVQGLYLGVDDCLKKPFEYEELIARMEAVMRRSSIFHHQQFFAQEEEKIIQELKIMIKEEAIVPFFQPIFRFNPFEVLGFEVLTRPKSMGLLSNPEVLFKAAIQFGFYEDLEMLVWRKAIDEVYPHLGQKKLFLNCNPYLIEGGRFLDIKSLFAQKNIESDHVVLEITERSAIADYSIFYERLHHYRDCGFKFAVDDMGGGYASLESIVQTRPEFVKIDRHIISELNKDYFKESIIKFIVAFCKDNHICSIAEGIETKEELEYLKGLGVDGGQGFYLCRPTAKLDLKSMMILRSS